MPCANHNTNQPTQQQMVQVKLGGLLCVQEQKVYPQDTQPTVVSKKNTIRPMEVSQLSIEFYCSTDRWPN